MSERLVIEKQIEKKNAEIQGLEEKLRNAKIYVKALNDVIKVLNRGSGRESGDSDSSLRKGSLVAQARNVILNKGTPVHLDQLLNELGKDVTRETKASLAGSIAAYVRKGEIFTRPEPSTFGLVELGHFEVEDSPVQPPQGFGQSEQPSDMDDEIPF